MLILFIIVYNRESVSVGKSAWFSRLLKIEFWTHGKVHDSRGGRRARARPRAFRKRAARERQIFEICRPPTTMVTSCSCILMVLPSFLMILPSRSVVRQLLVSGYYRSKLDRWTNFWKRDTVTFLVRSTLWPKTKCWPNQECDNVTFLKMVQRSNSLR